MSSLPSGDPLPPGVSSHLVDEPSIVEVCVLRTACERIFYSPSSSVGKGDRTGGDWIQLDLRQSSSVTKGPQSFIEKDGISFCEIIAGLEVGFRIDYNTLSKT